MNPLLIRLAVYLAVVAVSFGGGAYLGQTYASNACKAHKADAQDVAIEKHDEAATAGQVVERETVKRTVKTEAVFNGINQGVTTYAQNHPVVTDCRLDDDGLRLWNAANAGAGAIPSGERDAAVRGTVAPEERGNDGSADQSHRRGEGVSPVPGPASGVDQLVGENK